MDPALLTAMQGRCGEEKAEFVPCYFMGYQHRNSNVQEAEKYYKRFLKGVPIGSWPYEYVGQFYNGQKKYVEAEALLAETCKSQTGGKTCLLLASVQLKLEKKEEAKASLLTYSKFLDANADPFNATSAAKMANNLGLTDLAQKALNQSCNVGNMMACKELGKEAPNQNRAPAQVPVGVAPGLPGVTATPAKPY